MNKTLNILVLIVALCFMIVVVFDVHSKNVLFEDGSGIVTTTYCIPFMICEGG